MAPFTAIFSQMIGGQRVSNALATMLCLAPLVGAATGTAIAPLCLRHADSAIMPVAALPAAVACGVLLVVWARAGGHGGRTANPLARQDSGKSARGALAVRLARQPEPGQRSHIHHGRQAARAARRRR